MKAILTSIRVMLAHYVVPMLIMMPAMIATDNTPNEIPLFCFV